MSLRRKSAALSLAAAILATGARAAETNSPAAGQIDVLARQALNQNHSWGGSIAVARDGRTIFARGYGRAGKNGNEAAGPDTLYHIDSVTKNITAAVVLRLAEEKRLRLDDPLSKYIPEFPLHGHNVLIRQLLSHTSGIKGFTELPNWSAFEAKRMSHRQILDLIRNLPFDFPPGTSWRYSNSGFYLAGLVIERVSGESYGEYLRHLFRHLA